MPELQAPKRIRELEITQARLSKPMTAARGYFSLPSRLYATRHTSKLRKFKRTTLWTSKSPTVPTGEIQIF